MNLECWEVGHTEQTITRQIPHAECVCAQAVSCGLDVSEGV